MMTSTKRSTISIKIPALTLAAILLLITPCLDAQPKHGNSWSSLLQHNYPDKAPVIWAIGNAIYYAPDSNRAFHITDSLRSFGRKHNAPDIIAEADLQETFYRFSNIHGPQDALLDRIRALVERGREAKLLRLEACARDMLAEYYWRRLQHFEAALEEYTRLEELIRHQSFTGFPDKSRMLLHIGNAWYECRDYGKAIYYFLQIPHPVISEVFAIDSYFYSRTETAEAYRKKDMLDSSDYYYHDIAPFADSTKDLYHMAELRDGIGQNQVLRGRYEQAIPNFQSALQFALTLKDWPSAAERQMHLADIYFHRQQTTAATAATQKAGEYVAKAGLFDLKASLYPLLNKMYAANGQPQTSALYMDSTLYIKDSLARKYNALQLTRILENRVSYEQRHQAQEQQIASYKLFAALAALLILSLTGILTVRTLHQRHKRQQQDNEDALAAITNTIIEKNAQIEQLTSEKTTNDIGQLYQTSIATAQDWEKFSTLFEKVYPGFLAGLPEKIPGISPTECRFLALARLKLSNKEIAASLGVTPEAVRVTWHRLRKKTDLPAEATIHQLITSL